MRIKLISLLLLTLIASWAHAQTKTVPVPVNDPKSTGKLREILGLKEHEPINTVTTPKMPVVFYEVSFVSEDGVILHADYGHTPKNPEAATMILLHNISSSSAEFSKTREWLMEAGYSVLALDMRGYGRSTQTTNGLTLNGPKMEREGMAEFFEGMILDVDAALDWLEESDLIKRGGVYVMGRRVGALVASHSLVDNAVRLRGAIFDSPPLDYRRVSLIEPLENIQGRDILIIAERADQVIQISLRKIDSANPNVQTELIDDVPESYNLFDSEQAQETIKAFLERQIQRKSR